MHTIDVPIVNTVMYKCISTNTYVHDNLSIVDEMGNTGR